MCQQDRDPEADEEHHEAEEPQAAAETVGDAFERHEAAEHTASLLLEAGPAQSPLVIPSIMQPSPQRE